MGEPLLKLVDMNTGEVQADFNPGDRLIRGKTMDYLDRTIEINKDEPYVKVFYKPMFEVAKRLDGVSIQLLNLLLPYISYEYGILSYSNGRPLSRVSIIKLTELNEKTVDKCLNKLIDEQVLGKHKTGRTSCYTVNPFIFMKGKRVNKTLYKLFENSRWAKM